MSTVSSPAMQWACPPALRSTLAFVTRCVLFQGVSAGNPWGLPPAGVWFRPRSLRRRERECPKPDRRRPLRQQGTQAIAVAGAAFPADCEHFNAI